MFPSELDDLPPWEMSAEAWDAQLADLIRRDPGDPRFADDPSWDARAGECPLEHATADPAALSDTALIDTITALQRHLDWAGARQARVLAEFTRRRPHPTPAQPGTPRAATFSRWAPDEIALALSLSRVTALNRLAQAVQLRDDLPAVLKAWEHGRVDAAKVRAITDACLRVPVDLAAAVAERVLPRAPGQTLAQLKQSLKRAVIAVDPDGADQRHTQAGKKRRVVLNPDDDGMATLWAYLTAPQAMTAYGWLTALARGLGAQDPRSMDQRRADLFTALLTGHLTVVPPTPDPGPGGETTTAEPGHTPQPADSAEPADSADRADTVGGRATTAEAATSADSADHSADDLTGDRETCPSGPAEHTEHPTGPDRPPPRPEPPSPTGLPQPVNPGKPLVHVLVPITTLYRADHHPAELTGYGPIPATLARDIAADGLWKRLVTDPLSGTLLDHGRTTYRPPTATADFIRARDTHCRFPTCRRRALDCELDHTQAWTTDHGATTAENLYDACPHHHHLKHDAPGWTVTQNPGATLTWTTPTGHRYTSRPHDYRPEPDLTDPTRTGPEPEPPQPRPDPRNPFDRHPEPDTPDDAPF